MKLETIAFVVIIMSSLFGFVCFANLMHELSHKQDLKSLVLDDDVCFLTFPNNLTLHSFFVSKSAFYSFTLVNKNASTMKVYNNISKYTEYKAYSQEAVYMILYAICLFALLYRRYEK
jgi:hypothetical protein